MKKDELFTPCFILNEVDLKKNIGNFQKKLCSRFNNYIIGYSFKTNSLPRILEIVKESGCYAEVVSDDEYTLARRIGFEHKKIIYNGPVKHKKSFIEAVENGSLVNIDSKRELEWLNECNIFDESKVGIRVNFDLESKVPGQTSTGKHGGRFGFCYDNGELHNAISLINSLGIKISCLHMHVSNASKSPEVYKELGKMACEIMTKEKLNVEYIDFGGGYFGGGDEGESYEKYVSIFYETLKKCNCENLTVIVEPGASLIATAISYLTQVVDVKDTTYGRFVFTDGSRLDIDPFMIKEKYVNNIETSGTAIQDKQIICGYTCMEKDRIMVLENTQELVEGNRIEYRIVGSYTMCFNNLFISYLPNVYSKIDNDYYLIREKWGVDEYLQKNRWKI